MFDENVMLGSFFKQLLLAMHLLAPNLAAAGHPGPDEMANLRAIYTWLDRIQALAARRLAELEALGPEAVFVVHEWGGSWRPTDPKQHAIILVSEIIHGFERISQYTYLRLVVDPPAIPTLEQSVFGIEVRERARAGIKGLARSCRHWLLAPRKHANFANLLHETATITGWVELALGRFGEPTGPLAQADELTIEEVELVVRGLRIGSFSQSSLVIPLRELERGLEELRREERERIMNEEGREKGEWRRQREAD